MADGGEAVASELAHRYQTWIRATPETVWDALTDAHLTRAWFMGLSVQSSWQPGDPILQVLPDGRVWNEGRVLTAASPWRLVHTFASRHREAVADPPSRVSWTIDEATADVIRLTLVHDQFTSRSATYDMVGSGWASVLAELKSLLETGRPLGLSYGDPTSWLNSY